ncbi:MAG: NAD-binding protein [Bellilinea sp.]|jgi:hypothetical protein
MAQKKLKLINRLQYYFDQMFSRGAGMLIAALAVFTVLLSLATTLILITTGLAPGDEPSFNFVEGLWFSFLGNLGEGSVGGRESTWAYRFLTFGITLASIFIVSNLIGIISNAISQKIENLRRGRSAVLEKDHIVLLGWSEQVFTIIPQLMQTGNGSNKTRVVILGDMDKVEMEDLIRNRLGKKTLRSVICRRGNPMEMNDVDLTNINQAKGIVVLSPDSPHPDAEVVKTVLAITRNPNRRSGQFKIVAGLEESSTRGLGEILGVGEVEWIFTGEVIARILAQSCRQPGLSIVYSDLLDFTGEEIYFHSCTELIGRTYRESLSHFEKGAIVGLNQRDSGVKLNPPMETQIQAGDELIAIASDKDGIIAGKRQVVNDEWIVSKQPLQVEPESVIVLGWSDRARVVLLELDSYSHVRSKVCVVSNNPGAEEQISELKLGLENIKLIHESGSVTERKTLERLKIHKFNHVIILSNESENLTIQQIDSNTLFTLLHIRDIAEKKQARFSIVTEVLDARNSRLAEVAKADDFIVSDRLISLMMAQIVADPQRNKVYEDLFSPEGSEIYLKPARDYIKLGMPVNFYMIIEAAARRGETAIGYRIMSFADDVTRCFGVRINPNKGDEVIFTGRDKIIVLAEN